MLHVLDWELTEACYSQVEPAKRSNFRLVIEKTAKLDNRLKFSSNWLDYPIFQPMLWLIETGLGNGEKRFTK